MKIPKINKLPSGNYNVTLRLDGEVISITRSTKDQCRTEAQLIKSEYLAGKRQKLSTDAKQMTLREVQERYVEKYKTALSPSTVRSYTIYYQQRFKDYQNKKLPDITWQEMINKELEEKSQKTVKNAWGLVRPALEEVKYPVPEVKLAAVPVNEIPFLQPEEIKPFCAAIKGRSYEIPALLELHGLRLSEVRGLDWKNVDLINDTITIKESRVRGINGDVNKNTNKNQTSSRTIPIMIPQLHDALAAVENKTGLVAKIGANTLLDDVKRACKRANITEVTNHGLRHSFASLCFYLKIQDRQIQEWGGWKDKAVLHKIYIRLTAKGQSEAQKSFTKFFKNADKKANASSKHQ